MSDAIPSKLETVTAEPCLPGDKAAAEWHDFLVSSNNGTLFHNLHFLNYHPRDRFDIHNLIFRQDGNLIALLPAAIVTEANGSRLLKSPYGASVGGLVLPARQASATTLSIVTALKQYAVDLGLSAIEMIVGPNIYFKYPSDTAGFALAASGFELRRRWLTYVNPLPSAPEKAINLIMNKRRRRYYAKSVGQGLETTEVGAESLPEFHQLLTVNRAKRGAEPTHTLAELQGIFDLVPDQVRLFLCRRKCDLLAGSLIFELNDRIAYYMYLCHDEQFEHYRPAAFIVVSIAEYYIGRGFRYLDLGPTTFDDYTLHFNLARFKEELGAVGFCRDFWRWEAPTTYAGM